MKKLIFSTLALCLLMSSCSNNELLNSQIGDTETPQVQISEETPAMRKARAAAFVRQNPAVFGSNVRIFDSYDELDSTLAVLQDMDYKQLRQWANENNVENEILESNIIYAQEWEKAWEWIEAKPYPGGTIITHATFPGITTPVVELPDKVLNHFVETMQEKYPQYIVEYDSLGEHYIESLGALNEEILTNEKNIFLVDDNVHRFYNDGFVLCALEDYSQIAQCNSKAEVRQYVAEMHRTQQKAPQVAASDDIHTPYTYTEINGKYKMHTSFAVGLLPWIFKRDLRFMDVCVENYHKSCKGHWIGIACRTKYNLTATTKCSNNQSYTFDIHRKGFLLRWHPRYYHAMKNTGNNVKIVSYDLEVSNQHNLVIKRKS